MSLLTVRSREGCLYHLEGLSPGDYHGVTSLRIIIMKDRIRMRAVSAVKVGGLCFFYSIF